MLISLLVFTLVHVHRLNLYIATIGQQTCLEDNHLSRGIGDEIGKTAGQRLLRVYENTIERTCKGIGTVEQVILERFETILRCGFVGL